MPGHELIGKEELAAIQDIFESGAVLFAHGYHDRRKGIYRVRQFEKEFAEKLGSQHATAVSSGTAALKIALKALGINPGDEVITQSFTFIATIEAILDVGAVPVVTNLDRHLNLDPMELEKKITSKTKAVIPVHMHGFAADLESILKIAKERGIAVIEDNAQAIGGKYKGKALGTWGDIGAFSLDFNKAITTGEGGMVVTNNEKYAKFVREYHDHGHENNPSRPRGRDTRSIYGFNYRMTEIGAAVGRVQLKKLDVIVSESEKRHCAFESGFGLRDLMRPVATGTTPLFDTIMFRTQSAAQREQIIAHLTTVGIGTKNVPDAVEWHFAGYWNHVFSQDTIANLEPTAKRLNEYIAIPVIFGRDVAFYQKLGEDVRGLFF